MTTKHSPLRVLKAQSDKIAAMIKAFERGEPVDPNFDTQIREARLRNCFRIGLVMDDKIIKIDLLWTLINSVGEVALSEYILKLMQERRETLQ